MDERDVEKRLAVLEAEVANLKSGLPKGKLPWWKAIRGSFANDPLFDEAMRLGRAYRESLRPKPKKAKDKRKSNGAARHRSRQPAAARR